jgi:hypothetical protein
MKQALVDEIFVIKTFKSFHSVENSETNLEEPIQSLSNKICTSIENPSLLKQQREEATKMRRRFMEQEGVLEQQQEKMAEEIIEKKIEEFAENPIKKDSRYEGFSSEDYMREISSNATQTKKEPIVNDETPKPTIQETKKEEKIDTRSKLEKRLGIKKSTNQLQMSEKIKDDVKIKKNSEPEPNLLDLESDNQHQNKEELNEVFDLLDLGNNQNFINNKYEEDLLDFGKSSQQPVNDFDLMNPKPSSQTKKLEINASNKLFGDINTDLFDLNLNNINSSSSKLNLPKQQVQQPSISNINQSNYSKKKELNFNEFDFL